MKKSTFAALILGTVGGLLFALGICMVLLPEWNTFKPGVAMGAAGIVILLIMVAVWRKMENKTPIRLSGKTVGAILIGIIGVLLLGAGMCMVMAWDMMFWGIFVGIIGIMVLLCLIPFTLGLK